MGVGWIGKRQGERYCMMRVQGHVHSGGVLVGI